MRSIDYTALEKRFQMAAGLPSLTSVDEFFFKQAVNTRASLVWSRIKWPELQTLVEKTVAATTSPIAADKAVQIDNAVDVMDVFKKRSSIVRDIRNFLADQDFMEVETPVLHHIYGGASARPFTTHHNELKQDLYLRSALALHLKRLIVGGFEGVFEFAKDFRNEGMSRFHNPEFTHVSYTHLTLPTTPYV